MLWVRYGGAMAQAVWRICLRWTLALLCVMGVAAVPVPHGGTVAASRPHQLVHTWGTILTDLDGTTRAVGDMTASIPPRGDGPELTEWSWDVPLLNSGYDTARWTEEPIEIIGVWTSGAIRVTGYVERHDPPLDFVAQLPDEQPTPACTAEHAEDVRERFNRDFTRETREAAGVLSINLAMSGGYCGIVLTALIESPSIRELIIGYADEKVAVVYQVLPITATNSHD